MAPPGVAQPAAAAPAAERPVPAPLTLSNDQNFLASFAMRCAVAEKELRDQTNCFHPSELWSPLRLGALPECAPAPPATGAERAPGAKLEHGRPAHGGLWPVGENSVGENASSAAGGMVLDGERVCDSPLEPGLSKRDVSFSTQMVRRAVSFVFNDAIDDPASPLAEGRRRVESPHTAIAA